MKSIRLIEKLISSNSVSSSDNRELQIEKGRYVSSSSTAFPCESRELQVQQALPTSSSRLPLELTPRLFALFWYFLIVGFSLFAQSNPNTENYSFIKDLIDRSNLREAQRQIDIFKTKNENDPTLALYQAEIWIQTGEQNYRNANLKTAFENYKKAYEVYPSNSLLRSRYKELSDRVLFDSNSDIGKSTSSFPFYPLALQGSLNSEFSEKEIDKKMGAGWSKTELFLSVICIQNFLLLALHFFKRK